MRITQRDNKIEGWKSTRTWRENKIEGCKNRITFHFQFYFLFTFLYQRIETIVITVCSQFF